MLSYVIILPGIIGLILALTFVVLSCFGSAADNLGGAFFAFVVSLPLVVIGIVGLRFAKRRAMPQSLRAIGKSPILLKSMKIIPLPLVARVSNDDSLRETHNA